jgi:hypothetical protein
VAYPALPSAVVARRRYPIQLVRYSSTVVCYIVLAHRTPDSLELTSMEPIGASEEELEAT